MLDIDSLPIGIKPTNQMDFEELIEEKLRIADQLEQEHQELSKKSKVKKKELVKPTAEPIVDQIPDDSDLQIEISIDDEEEVQCELESELCDSKPKPKPFLRRGEGLKRYQPHSKKILDANKKSLLNRKSVSTSNLISKPKQTVQSNTKTRTLSRNPPKPVEKPKKIENKTQTTIKSKSSSNSKLEVKKNQPKVPEKPSENIKLDNQVESEDDEFNSNYFQPKLVQSSNNYNDQHHNDTELKEFENLEKYVEEHPSFQTSIVKNFSSKTNTDQLAEYESNDNYNENYLERRNFFSKFEDSDMEEFMDKHYDANFDKDMDDLDSSNRTLENENKNHNTSGSSSVLSRKIKRISSNNKLPNSTDYLSGLLNEKNYICGNYENEDMDNYDLNMKYGHGKNEKLTYESYRSYKSSFESLESGRMVKFDDSSSWLEQTENNDDKYRDKNEYSDENRGPVSKLINKLFPSIKEQEEKQKNAMIKQQMRNDQEVFERMKQEQMKNVTESQKPNNSATSNINANVLREKINQLETEIELFKKKNVELNKLKEKLDTEVKLAETNRKLFDKQKQEELSKLKEIHDEEMRKLKQEKKIFEQYKQSVKDKPDRKEREEIEKLNKQLIELSDEMKTRESRWIANNNRLKERIDSLEKEKIELKKEIQLFEKQRIESLMKMSNNSGQSRSESPNSYSATSKNHFNANNSKNLNKNLIINTNNYDTDYFPNQQSSYPNLKRTTSEKSLPNSSPTSSSSSIGSTSSLATNSNTNFNQPQPNIIQQNYHPHTINSPLTSNSFDSVKSDLRIQNHKSYSPQQPNLVKSVKFNPEQLKETRYYSPNRTDLIENEEYDNRTNSLPVNLPNTSNNLNRLSLQNLLTTEPDFAISSVTGIDRKLKVKDVRVVQGKHTEKLLEDSTLLTIFPNGTIKEVSDDKMKILVKFFNGDRKEINRETGTETYSYAETQITQVIYSNGLEILKFPNGQIEKHHVDKTKEIIFPDKICKFIYSDGSEETRLPNGTLIKVDKNGDKVIDYPNKQREIHTKEFKKREYPDGSVKTVYTNGLSETRYSNGRVRLKDSLGNIISDTKP